MGRARVGVVVDCFIILFRLRRAFERAPFKRTFLDSWKSIHHRFTNDDRRDHWLVSSKIYPRFGLFFCGFFFFFLFLFCWFFCFLCCCVVFFWFLCFCCV